jgi:ABC-type glycerol-3-phosphate transport system substrate-binding protein
MKAIVKIKWVGILLLIVSVLLAACGDSKEAESVKPDEPSVSNEPKEIVIYTMHTNSEAEFNIRFGDMVKKKFPNYTIKFLNSQTGGSVEQMMLTETYFDIFWATTGNLERSVFQYGFEYDMSELIKKSKVDLTRYDPAFKNMLEKSYGGRIYFLPFHADTPVIYYNKDIFDKFSVPYPKDGMTWEELAQLARQLTRTEDGVLYVGFDPPGGSFFTMNQLSIPLLEPGTLTPTINKDPRWATFFQKYAADMGSAAGENRGSLSASAGKINDVFFKGKQAMMMSLPYIMMTRKAEFDLVKFGVVSAPVLAEAPNKGFSIYPANLSISKNSKHKEDAMEILKYLISDEAQASLARKGFVPVVSSPEVRKSLGADSSYSDYNWAAAFKNPFSEYLYHGPYATDVSSIYSKYFNEVMYDRMDINTALRKAEEEAVKKIEEVSKSIKVDYNK